jgi:hypothetical protein
MEDETVNGEFVYDVELICDHKDNRVCKEWDTDMGLAKHQYHDDINNSGGEGPCFAEQEYYAEMERHEQNKKRRALIARPATVLPKDTFQFSAPFQADPATDAERFQQACREADTAAAYSKTPFIVFKAPHGFYFTREKKHTLPPIEILYDTEAGNG